VGQHLSALFAAVEWSVSVCDAHDAAESSCAQCGSRYAVDVAYRCPTCGADHGGMFANHLLTEPVLVAVLLDHDVDPLSPPPRRFSASVWVYDEAVRSEDPFEAAFTFTIDGDALTLTVDDLLEVVEVAERSARETS